MQQVLFHLPIPIPGMPDGIPIYGFGLMLFLCFVICTAFLAYRAKPMGIPPDRIQDMTIFLFVVGIIGARITYMIQYKRPIWEFIQIWNGGIVFYGAAIGGFIGYRFFYRRYIRPLGVSTWTLADVIAPTLALGLAIGRVGCFLNGCCYGHVADPNSISAHFPILSCPARDVLIGREGLQSSLGFTIAERDRFTDPRTVIDRVEVGSEAENAGFQAGDRVVSFNDEPNYILLRMTDKLDSVDAVAKYLQEVELPARPTRTDEGTIGMLTIPFADAEQFRRELAKIRKMGSPLQVVYPTDSLTQLVNDWPRGLKDVRFTVQRGTQTVELAPYTSRSLGLYPTQIYETISMVLLFTFLVLYYPFRQYDGQVFVFMMMAYAVHRFVNEQLRNDTDTVAFRMTLSQCISILIFSAALFLQWCLTTAPGMP